MEGPRTSILVVKLQEITLMVKFVLMAVEKRKNRLQLGDGILADIHDRRLVCVDDGQRA